MIVDGVDASRLPDLAGLPAVIRVVCGYVGAPDTTPHVWTPDDAQAVRATGREWWPIWVAPVRALTANDGLTAGQAMARVLPFYSLPPSTPVFYDVERTAWDADPAGANLAIAAWQQVMRTAGHARAYAYRPAGTGPGWQADWTDVRPGSLPPGVVGIQWSGSGSLDYDRDVFDAALLQPPAPPPADGEDSIMLMVSYDPATAPAGAPPDEILLISGSLVVHVQAGSSVPALAAAGVRSAQVDYGTFQALRAAERPAG